LVVPPVLGGTLPMAYWCAEALEHLGCRVATVPLEAVRPLYDLVRRSRRPQEELDRVRRPMVRFLGEAALLAAREHRPHLVLALAQAPLDRAAIAGLGELGAATAMWFVENHRHMGYYREIAASYDHFFHIQPGPLEDELQRLGARHAFLPLAAHPPVHRPLCLEPDEVRRWGAEIGFMGCGYPNRREVLARLAGRGLEVALWGTSWGPLASRVREGGRRLETREVVKIYNACQMVLNLHSSPEAGDGVAAQDFVNPRTFEVAACGGFQLVDRVRGLEGLFKPGAEIAAYASEEELMELARHYRDRPEERAALAAKARRRALAEHTYYHRMESLLEACLGRAPAEDALDPAGAAGRAAETLLDSLAPAEGVRAL
jgi:spore maturation protein CgeB